MSIRPINPSNILWLWLDLSFLTCGIPILPFQADFTIFSDAPTQRWGAHMGDSQISDTWTHSDRKLLTPLGYSVSGQQVMIAADNTTIVSYINKQGGTRSPSLLRVSVDLFLWLQSKDIDLRSQAYSRLSKCDSRLPVSQSRVESRFQDRNPNLRDMGIFNSGHVCPNPLCPASPIYFF